MPRAEIVCEPGNTSKKLSKAVLVLMSNLPATTKNERVISGPYCTVPGPIFTELVIVVLVPSDCLLDGPLGPSAPRLLRALSTTAPFGPASTWLSTACNGPLPGTMTPDDPPGISVS